MELNDRVTQLEDEIKVLKNEVQAVLLDLRDSYLNRENPFNSAVSPAAGQPIIINQPSVERPPIAKEEEEQDDILPAKNEENELPGVEEANEQEPVSEQELIASEETAHEEVKRAWQPEIEPGFHFEPRETTESPGGKVDLATIAKLAQWVAEAVKQLGRERTEAILNISEMMGHVSPDLKNILVKFINPILGEPSGKVTTRDYLASLIELDSLLGKDNKSEIALLSILCQENNHG